MPHRHQEFRELCVQCDGFSVAECQRCGAPLCAEHSPAPRRRCEQCELDYDQRIAPITRALDRRKQMLSVALIKPMAISAVIGLISMLGVIPGVVIPVVGGVAAVLFFMSTLIAMIFFFLFAVGTAAEGASQGIRPHLQQARLRRARRRFLRERAPRALPSGQPSYAPPQQCR
ncbi:MAG: hypothetical protein AAGC55_18095 [Myxococcota bacterium]